jgi:UDP-N-acetylmuramate--alanine ligase
MAQPADSRMASAEPAVTVPDPSAWRTLHLVGIGGAGMSGIARLLLERGIEISGSDLKDSRSLEGLRSLGARIFVGHRNGQIGRPDAVVVSAAIPQRNAEVQEAVEAGIPVLSRAQVLAALMQGFAHSVAVAGTHGKTTTTSMITVLLARVGSDPTYVIGGDLNESGSGAGSGSGDVFVAEADESDGSFLLFDPEIGVITNVEEDHLDFYSGRDAVVEAFRAFAATAGLVVACWDDDGVRLALEAHPGEVVRYGRGEGVHVRVEDEGLRPGGCWARVRLPGGASVEIVLSVPGRHNVLNATGALAVAVRLGVDPQVAAQALGSFSGVRRRFEDRGGARGARFVDDYAHHPTEVRAALSAALENPAGRLVAVFQPHRYTRTRGMWRALGESLEAADVVVLTDVYAAGEPPIPGVTGKLLVDALTEARPGKRVVYLPRRSDVAPFLAGEVREGDLILTLGAGDITMVGEETLSRIRGAAGMTDTTDGGGAA